MRDYKFSLNAGQIRSVNVTGDYYHVIKANGEIKIGFDDGGLLARYETMGGSSIYQKVSVYSPIAQTVILTLGYGKIYDARATVNATIGTVIKPANLNIPLPSVTVGSGLSILLAPALPTRKELRIGIKSTEPDGIYIGDASVGAIALGGWMEIGSAEYITSEAAIYGYNPGLLPVSVNLLSLERP